MRGFCKKGVEEDIGKAREDSDTTNSLPKAGKSKTKTKTRKTKTNPLLCRPSYQRVEDKAKLRLGAA